MTADASSRGRPLVCVQGLGFVGTAMAIATASALDASGNPVFEVAGVDLPTADGSSKVEALNAAELPLACNDRELQLALKECRQRGNLSATTDEAVYANADVVLVDIHLDVRFDAADAPEVDFSGFRAAISTLGRRMKPGALVIVETTVPPGTCEHVVVPELASALRARELPADALLVAHSYERVMPGRDYLRSITNFWRVYSGVTEQAADACERFLSRIINTRDFPLTRLPSTKASETAKILENSYRAANIAFIHEWGRFAEAAGIDLFAVLEAIRVRPTHDNIRQPGFGVGGYCLTKDPALVMAGSAQLLNLRGLDFPFCKLAMSTNALMPMHSLDRLREALGGKLHGKTVLVLGVSYRQDVGDTRYSPAETFVRAAEKEGARVVAHDPMLQRWPELDRSLSANLPDPLEVDAIVFAVPHQDYREMDVASWLRTARPVLLDANNVLGPSQVSALRESGHRLHFVGRGD